MSTDVCFQPARPLYEAELAEVVDPYFRLIVEGVICQWLKDLHSLQRREAAESWFTHGEAFCWCQETGACYDELMERVEAELDRVPVDHNRRKGRRLSTADPIS